MKVEWARLGDVLELQRRSASPRVDEKCVEIGVRSFGRGLFLKSPTTGGEIGAKRVFRIEPGDLIFSNVFAWEGAVAVADRRHEGAIGSHRFMTWTPKDAQRLLPQFVAHYFTSDQGLAALRAASPGSAGRNRTLSIKNLERIEIPLPSADDQRRISAHLDRVEECACLGQRESTDLLGGLRSTIVRRATERAAEITLGDLVAIERTWMEIDPESRYRAIGVRGFGRGMIRYPETPADQLSKLRYYPVVPHRLIVSNIKAWEGAVTVSDGADAGRVASNRFLQYRVDDERVTLTWLQLYLTSDEGTRALASASPGSADRNRTLSMSNLEGLTVPVPAMDVQDRVAAVERRLRLSVNASQRAGRLRQALLPAARNEIFSSMR